jgi:hypothetical protein
VGFVCFVLDFVNQDHILKHGRVIGSDLRPPSVTGMAKPAVQRLLRANRDPLSQVRQHLHSLSHADTHHLSNSHADVVLVAVCCARSLSRMRTIPPCGIRCWDWRSFAFSATRSVSKNGLFAPVIYKHEYFTKTGSGQT